MRREGFSLLETLATLTVTAVAVLAGVSGLRQLAAQIRVDAARDILVNALLDARRSAYVKASTASLRVTPGGSVLEQFAIDAAPRRIDLPVPVVVRSAPADNTVSFAPSGLADNATIIVGCAPSGPQSTVVVNQRGVIR